MAAFIPQSVKPAAFQQIATDRQESPQPGRCGGSLAGTGTRFQPKRWQTPGCGRSAFALQRWVSDEVRRDEAAVGVCGTAAPDHRLADLQLSPVACNKVAAYHL
jgi:hypothetical protein